MLVSIKDMYNLIPQKQWRLSIKKGMREGRKTDKFKRIPSKPTSSSPLIIVVCKKEKNWLKNFQ